jgi:hypothetical protein
MQALSMARLWKPFLILLHAWWPSSCRQIRKGNGSKFFIIKKTGALVSEHLTFKPYSYLILVWRLRFPCFAIGWIISILFISWTDTVVVLCAFGLIVRMALFVLSWNMQQALGLQDKQSVVTKQIRSLKHYHILGASYWKQISYWYTSKYVYKFIILGRVLSRKWILFHRIDKIVRII